MRSNLTTRRMELNRRARGLPARRVTFFAASLLIFTFVDSTRAPNAAAATGYAPVGKSCEGLFRSSEAKRVARDPKTGHRAEVFAQNGFGNFDYVIVTEPGAMRSGGSGYQPQQRLALAISKDGTIETVSVSDSPLVGFDPAGNSGERSGRGKRDEIFTPGANAIAHTPMKGVFIVGTKTGELNLIRFGRKSFEMLGLDDSVMVSEISSRAIFSDSAADSAIIDLSFVTASRRHGAQPLPLLRVTRAGGAVETYDLSIEQWNQIVSFGKS